MKSSCIFTTRPCRSVFFRCYDNKYYVPPPHFAWNSVVLSWKKGLHAAKTGWKPNRCITMPSYRSWCCEQRRAESPIRIQPRAAPWVKMFQQTCALKEQKEGRPSISLAPFALTARQLVNELKHRVLPWAVIPLGLRPVIARNINRCTLSWAIFDVASKGGLKA